MYFFLLPSMSFSDLQSTTDPLYSQVFTGKSANSKFWSVTAQRTSAIQKLFYTCISEWILLCLNTQTMYSYPYLSLLVGLTGWSRGIKIFILSLQNEFYLSNILVHFFLTYPFSEVLRNLFFIFLSFGRRWIFLRLFWFYYHFPLHLIFYQISKETLLLFSRLSLEAANSPHIKYSQSKRAPLP